MVNTEEAFKNAKYSEKSSLGVASLTQMVTLKIFC